MYWAETLFRHAELVSASMVQSCELAPWTLKQVQGDDIRDRMIFR
jgi:hypothetical protein